MDNKSDMVSLAKKSGPMESTIKEVYYPSVSMDMNAMKELSKCSIGDEVMMLIKCKITGMNEYGSGEKTCNMDMLEADVVEDVSEGKKEEEEGE